MSAHPSIPVQPVTAEHRRVMADSAARLYRCPGCGAIRYRYRLGRWHRQQPPCAACGHH